MSAIPISKLFLILNSAVSGIGHDKDKELVHSEDLASLSSSSTNVRSEINFY
jgi:hypothetical protein